MVDVVVLDDWQDVARSFAAWARLSDRARVHFRHDHLFDPDVLVEELHHAAVVVAMRERTAFPSSVLERLPQLRLLVTAGMGNAAIDLEAAAALGITVSGTAMRTPPTAELTWGLILAALRHIPEEHQRVRDGLWQGSVGTDLAERRLGLIGLGRLGGRVARVGLAFDMDVVAWSQNLTQERADEVGVGYVDLDELLATSDIVSLHLRLSPRTRGLLGDRELRLMKPTALLVNTSRGPLVDEDALVAALAEGRLRGAALDVFDEEPLPPGHRLRTAPRVLHTPHLGYVTEASYERIYGDVVEDIEAWLDGAPIRVLAPAPD
ncbi:MAG TPA: D-2-hydroxyacid dehydrogenase family protein [Actinomycetes bacterium]|nr:D-2-hydroxyacid dehydrogenase family protein [Actinomycetes bacterium]